MNKGYFNSKYNIIIGTGVDESKILNINTEHNIIHRVNTDKSFQQICFNIKKYQLDHDEVFSGNVIIYCVIFRTFIKFSLDEISREVMSIVILIPHYIAVFDSRLFR